MEVHRFLKQNVHVTPMSQGASAIFVQPMKDFISIVLKKTDCFITWPTS